MSTTKHNTHEQAAPQFVATIQYDASDEGAKEPEWKIHETGKYSFLDLHNLIDDLVLAAGSNSFIPLSKIYSITITAV
jgi:hypothetical protein